MRGFEVFGTATAVAGGGAMGAGSEAESLEPSMAEVRTCPGVHEAQAGPELQAEDPGAEVRGWAEHLGLHGGSSVLGQGAQQLVPLAVDAAEGTDDEGA